MSYFHDVLLDAAKLIREQGQVHETNNWQARESHMKMREIFNFNFTVTIPGSIEDAQIITNPNLPWAEDHFQERVSGIPMNPAPSYEWWPFYKQDEKWRPDGVFSHTYPERMWTPALHGVRYDYGNLGDVVKMLQQDPTTRQAFLPIWFPEDTGAVHGERVPCTIGYQFYIRDGQLNMFYPMRSCDFRRHFRNDVYMAMRLGQWVAEQTGTRPGTLSMNVWNLHVFEGEEWFL